jgi:uncharacterized membrane protein
MTDTLILIGYIVMFILTVAIALLTIPYCLISGILCIRDGIRNRSWLDLAFGLSLAGVSAILSYPLFNGIYLYYVWIVQHIIPKLSA